MWARGSCVGRRTAEGVHVALEVELLHGGEAVVVGAGPLGGVEQHVVDVGDVAADLDVHAEPAQHPVGGVDPHEGGGVAEVGDVVRRDAADVDAGAADDRQRLATAGAVGAGRSGRARGLLGGAAGRRRQPATAGQRLRRDCTAAQKRVVVARAPASSGASTLLAGDLLDGVVEPRLRARRPRRRADARDERAAEQREQQPGEQAADEQQRRQREALDPRQRARRRRAAGSPDRRARAATARRRGR